MTTITYEFEELPLIVEDGFEAGLVSGSANISYYEDGEWFIHEIYLDGFKGRERKQVQVEEGRVNARSLYHTIWNQLDEGRFKDFIQAKVDAALEEAGVSTRSDRAEHSTHHAALSGVA